MARKPKKMTDATRADNLAEIAALEAERDAGVPAEVIAEWRAQLDTHIEAYTKGLLEALAANPTIDDARSPETPPVSASRRRGRTGARSRRTVRR